MVQAAKAEREKLERKLEALKKDQRETETVYRRSCAEKIEEAFLILSKVDRDVVTKEFQLSLGNIYLCGCLQKSGLERPAERCGD